MPPLRSKPPFDVALWIMLLLAAAIFLLNSCSTLYYKVSKTPPLTTKDTFELSGRCVSVFKADTAVEIRWLILPQREDSSTYFKRIADSALTADRGTREIINNVYRDTCTSAQNVYAAGYNLGYRVGLYTGKQGIIHDTVERDITKTVTGGPELVHALTRAELAEADAEKYRGKWESSRTMNIWLLVILAACAVGFYAYSKIKKIL